MCTLFVWSRTIVRNLYAYRTRIGTIATAHALLTALDWPFDYVLYPTVLIFCGPLLGTALMMTLALLLNVAILRMYVANGTDWLGVREVEALKHTVDLAKTEHIVTRALQWATRHGDTATFFFFSIFKDPFWTVAFLRKGRPGPITPRDWRVFWASFAVANLYWAGRWVLTIEGALWIYQTMFDPIVRVPVP